MKKIVLLLIFIVIGGSVYLLQGQNQSESENLSENLEEGHVANNQGGQKGNPSGGTNVQGSGKDGKKTVGKGGKLGSPKPKTKEEAKSLLEKNREFAEREIDFKPKDEEEAGLLETQRKLATFYNIPQTENNLVEFFKEKGLEPKVAKDTNPYTGTMITVRTNKALPGTRYNHAQYFANERGESYLQHYSIEYRPGPQAFERAQEMVESLYNVKNGKVSKDGNFISYKLSDDYIIWMKRMGKEDLKDDPFNAYEESDVGTIRMAIEMEIHDEGHEHDVHFEPEGGAEGDGHQH